MRSIPDVQVETRPTTGSSSGGGGGASKVWTITGQVRVRESEIDGDLHDRPLKGIEVKVSASDIGADGPVDGMGDGADRRRRRLRRLRDEQRQVPVLPCPGPPVRRRSGRRGRHNRRPRGARPGRQELAHDLEVRNSARRPGGLRRHPGVRVGSVARPRRSDLPPPGTDLVRAACNHRPPQSRGSVVRDRHPDQGALPVQPVPAHVLQRRRQAVPARGARRCLVSRLCAGAVHADVA